MEIYVSEATPPADLASRHGWPMQWPYFLSAGITTAASVGAIGDGYTDCWEQLQTALARPNAIVVLSRGRYQVSRPLVVPAGSALVGIARHLSVISPSPGGLMDPTNISNESFGRNWGSSLPTVVLGDSRSAGARDGKPSIVSHLTVETPIHLTNVTGITAIGPFLSRQAYTHRKNVCGSDWSAPCQNLWRDSQRVTEPQMKFMTGSSG